MKRKSLFSCLLMVLLVVVFGILVQQRIQLVQLQSELGQLLADFPPLDADNSDQVKVIRISEFGRGRWNWRVWVPEEQTLYLGYKVGQPNGSMATLGSRKLDLEPGSQYLVSIALDQRMMLGMYVEAMQETKIRFSAKVAQGIGQSLDQLRLFDFDWSDEFLGQELLQLAGDQRTEFSSVSQPVTLLKLRKKGEGESDIDSWPIIEIWISNFLPAEDSAED